MVLQVVYTAATSLFPSKYYLHIAVSAGVLLVTYAFAQGRTTNRERDLHARVIMITGAFTPLGLTLLTALAARGAHIIAVSPYPLDHPYPSLLIPLLRSTTGNENIFAECADLARTASIREFCTRFLTGGDQRLDALVFAHEYQPVGTLFGGRQGAKERAERRERASLATFLMATLLLPALLVEPVERDIRIVTLVNPFYAASAPKFSKNLSEAGSDTTASTPLFLAEGFRALRTAVLMRHLQRILDSLPNRASAPAPSEQEAGQAEVGHPSNIIAVSACPGISRKDIIAPLLCAERDSDDGCYALLFPFSALFMKSPTAAAQTVLHALFLPTPIKRALAHVDATINPSPAAPPAHSVTGDKTVEPTIVLEEVLKPGALYRECAVVQVAVPPLLMSDARSEPEKGRTGRKTNAEESAAPGFPDDGEFGGEAVGRAVWEWYEERLKRWEALEKAEGEVAGKA
ncbi:uncharacterized protein FIBRA_05131 [Fibroporia radiculosa]|uniref:Ketoreductase (KR) domain-containing protein n=1 Tax=Fibroporia radiculosa TaxID=599839 RepID=J4H3C1_9APHY|nr:uncharacterized protein FIBRA_05131 [Fibroporia radiculosa]CCM03014.1 predicted protein [Fibroporia radiculosa]